jgi:hypothetical protein
MLRDFNKNDRTSNDKIWNLKETLHNQLQLSNMLRFTPKLIYTFLAKVRFFAIEFKSLELLLF